MIMKKMVDAWMQNLPTEDVIIVPKKVLHLAGGKIWKLRLIVIFLTLTCSILAAVSLKSQTAVSHLLHLEQENRTKDATIEQLQREKKVLEEKLSFKGRVDELVAKIQKEVPRLNAGIIRPAAEIALSNTTDPALYLAIGLVETMFRADIVHTDGVARGMHGLCPLQWHSFLNEKGIMRSLDDYFDPVKSFKGAEAVLSALLQECGSLEKALRYYNGGGPAASGRIPKSTAYAKRVMYLRGLFKV